MNKGKLTLSNGEVITAWQNDEGGLHIGTDDGPIVPDYGDLTFTPDPITELPVGTVLRYETSPSGATYEKREGGWVYVQPTSFKNDIAFLNDIDQGYAEIALPAERAIVKIIDGDGDLWYPTYGRTGFIMRSKNVGRHEQSQLQEMYGIQEIVYK